MNRGRVIWTERMMTKAEQAKAAGLGKRKIAALVGVSHGAYRYHFEPRHRENCKRALKESHMRSRNT